MPMHCYRWHGNKRFLQSVSWIVAWPLMSTIAFQSSKFFALREHSTILSHFDGRAGTCCRVVPSRSHNENTPVEGNLTVFPHISKSKGDEPVEDGGYELSSKRRDIVLSTVAGVLGVSGTARAIDNIFYKKGLYMLDTKDAESASSSWNEQVEVFPKLSSEYALLRVLPVKNTVFRTVEQNLEALSVLRYRSETNKETIDKAWAKADTSVVTVLNILTNKRNQLEPVFNSDDTTDVTAIKIERGETLLRDLRQDLEYLKEGIHKKNITCAFLKQRSALLTLGFIGELLVKKYPYKVPYKGKYSFLPRLLGRAQVTFRFKRNGSTLGDVRIVADGYVAPITAGNFIDLCVRNFYTGLPIKGPAKKNGLLNQVTQENLPINILGSYNEGFYDPLTGQLRQIPLEVIVIEGTQKLSYSYSRQFAKPDFEVGEAMFVPALTNKPLLTFETPGLVAFNHPIGNPNGGSSEFFALQGSAIKDVAFKRTKLDCQYAPFGYIIEGFDVFESLQPGDTIESTSVDNFGQLNLVKIRSSTFKEVAQGTDVASAQAREGSSTSEKTDEGTQGKFTPEKEK